MAFKKVKNPVTSIEEVDALTVDRVRQHYDDQLDAIGDELVNLDARQIAQITTLEDSAALADVISKLNTLLEALNDSQLTEDT